MPGPIAEIGPAVPVAVPSTESELPPIPEISPPMRYHSHNFRLGQMVDRLTGGPEGCDCAQCGATRRAIEAEEETARRRKLYDTNRDAAWRRMTELHTVVGADGDRALEACGDCGQTCTPHCPRCRRCTRVTSTLQEAMDACVIFARMWVEVTPLSKLQERYDAIRAGELGPASDEKKAQSARIALVYNVSRVPQHCTCYECESCHTLHEVCQMCGRPADCPDSASRCECWVCPNCTARRVNEPGLQRVECDTCGKYNNCCCRCQKCQKCGVKQSSSVRGRMGGLIENRCQSCGFCIDCCGCIKVDTANLPMPPEEEIRPGIVWQRGAMKHFPATGKWGLLGSGVPFKGQYNPFKRLIGQEIEVGGNGTRNMNQVVVKKWTGCIVQDGSIPDTGFEINTSPAGGDQYIQQLRDIIAECGRTGVWVNSQCGLHTHVDTSDFNIWSMRRLINLYRRAEPHMFSMLPSVRHGNHFCTPCGDSWWTVFNEPGKIHELKTRYINVPEKDEAGETVIKKRRKVEETFHNPTASLKGKLTAALYARNPNEYATNKDRQRVAKELEAHKSGKDNNTRYRALNVHSWLLRGTLEFRHGAPAMELHHTTRSAKVPVQGDYIVNWGLTCAGLVEAAARMSDSDVDKLGDGGHGLTKSPASKQANMTWDEFKKLIVPAHLHTWADETKAYCAKPANASGLGPVRSTETGRYDPCGENCNANDCDGSCVDPHRGHC